MQTFPEQLNKTYFWDIIPENLDETQSKRLIIERVMNYGTLGEIRLIIDHYGKEEIRKTICSLNYIDPKTLNFLSLLFHIPKTRFKCFTRKQLTPQHWSY
jgi:hypothetical protein